MRGGRKPVQVQVVEDEVWRYYGNASLVWGQKCASCRAYVAREGHPSKEALACWKVEVWEHGSLAEHLQLTPLESLAESLARDYSAIVKVSRSRIRVERTGIPESGYPADETDMLLMVYAEDPTERDALRAAVCRGLGVDPSLSEAIPIRRGCWIYDDILGPWTMWPDHNPRKHRA